MSFKLINKAVCIKGSILYSKITAGKVVFHRSKPSHMEFKNQHVVLFPFMAQGHITPFLLLADLIHKTYPNYTVTLLNTPLNIQNIQSSLPPNSKINLKSLPFDPTDHGLPSGAESFATVPRHLFLNVFRATEALQPSFEELIADIIKQDGDAHLCIIADYFLAWTVGVARKLGAFHAIFFTGGAYGTAIFRYLWMNLPQRNTTILEEEISLPEFAPIRIHRSQLSKPLAASNGSDGFSVFMQRQFQLCSRSDSALVNTVEEFERLGLSMLRMSLDIPVLPVGPLANILGLNLIEPNLLRWLDSQPPASVIFISFGSQNAIRDSQMMKLAMALEASNRPFIWVISTSLGSDMEVFEERMRMKKQGLIVRGWAPQVGILSHSSTGAFLSHCGWNSVLESLIHGVPIIGWPLSAEQFYNSKFLEEVAGVGVEVARGNLESSKVVEEEIERGIEVVMGNKEIRRKANEIRELFRGALNQEADGNGGSGPSGLKEFFEVVVSKKGLI